MIGIYKITSPTGRVYIGQSVDIEKRKSQYSRIVNCKEQPAILNSLLKYGWNSHVFEILETCPLEKLNERERFWQEFFNSVEKGLNCKYTTYSDKSGRWSDEVKKKIKDNHASKKPGYISHLKGLPKSKEQIRKAVETKKLRDYTGSRNKLSKILLCTQTGIFYDSITEAAKIFNLTHGGLSKMLRGVRKNKTNLIYT